MGTPILSGLVIEGFDPDRHDRDAFSCGVSSVDNYFKKTANKLAKAGNLRLFVMADRHGQVAGFYALNAHSVRLDALPERYGRTAPRHGDIPGAFIAMMGRDMRYAGQGLGGILLADALKRVAKASDQLGIAVVLLDVLDCGDEDRTRRRKALYESYGFTPLPSQPMRLFLPLATIRQLI